jgi:hypothetical protein
MRKLLHAYSFRAALRKYRAVFSAILLSGLAGSSAFAQGSGLPCTIGVANASGARIAEVFTSPSGRGWGGNRLEDRFLEAGRTAAFDVTRGLHWDLRVRWEGGQVAEIRNVDVCSSVRVTATRWQLTLEPR